MKSAVVIVVASLLVSATARADDGDEVVDDDLETVSYKTYTLTTDLVGVSLLFAGAVAEGDDGRDSNASEALFAVGSLTSMFGTPVIHLSRGHAGRAVGSLVMRAGLAGFGAMLAMSANSDCHDNAKNDGSLLGDDFLCELDYAGYGMLGGLVVASVIDAAFLTDEKVERPTWSPQLAATHEGVRAGLAFQW